MHPLMVRRASLKGVFSLLVCEDWFQAGEQYSVGAITRERVDTRSTSKHAPQLRPASRFTRATLEVILLFNFSICWRKVNDQSRVTPRYRGVETRGGVEDTRLEAKDTKKIRGLGQGQPFRGQTLSRPRTGMLEAKAKDQGHKRKCSPKKKKVFTKVFQAIS